jgi:acyl-CoA thioester hydrolase
MFVHDFKKRVRYGETDQMGYVYYGQYANYYEIGRTEAIRSIGYPYRRLEEAGVMLPVLENHSIYIKPAHYDDLLTIRVTVPRLPTVKFYFEYEILREEEVIHRGNTTLAFVNMESGRPCRPPAEFLKVIRPYFDGR